MEESEKLQPTEGEEEEEKTITRRAEDYREIYINTVRAAASPWDLRYFLGVSTGSAADEPVNEEKVVIIMSPQHAKAFLTVVLRSVFGWEQSFGKINVPPEFDIPLKPKSIESKDASTEKSE